MSSRKREYQLQASEIVEHSELEGLTNDDHPQYVHNDVARTITAIQVFNTTAAPFAIGADSADVLVDGLNADLLDGYEAAAFALLVHTHTKSQITDLETITTTPAASSVPKADGANKIDNGWLKTGSGNGLDADTVDGYHLNGDIIHPFLFTL